MVAKVATNSFRVKELTGNGILVLPGDVLIKAASLTREDLKGLVREMEAIAARNATLSAPPSRGGDRDQQV